MINLDIACGANKNKGFVGIDLRPLPGVDIVHDLEVFPWPIESGSVRLAIASHFVEHLDPCIFYRFYGRSMEEFLFLMGNFYSYALSWIAWLLARPHPLQGWNEATFQYFDPDYPLYQIYKPKPWKIRKGFPTWQMQGNLEVILNKAEVIVNLALHLELM